MPQWEDVHVDCFATFCLDEPGKKNINFDKQNRYEKLCYKKAEILLGPSAH